MEKSPKATFPVHPSAEGGRIDGWTTKELVSCLTPLLSNLRDSPPDVSTR